MAQRHPWTHVKDADIPRLDAEVHDAELLKLAIRPKLLRLELQLFGMGGKRGRLELQFLEVCGIQSGPLSTQNVFGGIELCRAKELPEHERKQISWVDPECPVYTFETGTTFWLQVACERLERRVPR